MADLVTIGQLGALIEDQYRLLAFLEDHPGVVPPFDPIFPERNQIDIEVHGEPWSITVTRSWWECCHRNAGRTVLLRSDHPSPFDFHPNALLRFVRSIDATSQLNEIVIDNWVLALLRRGRLSASRHRDGYFTFA